MSRRPVDLLIRSLIVAGILTGIGCGDDALETEGGGPSDSAFPATTGQAARGTLLGGPLAGSESGLPSSYGMYVVDQGKTRRVVTVLGNESRLTSGAEFLYFDRDVASGERSTFVVREIEFSPTRKRWEPGTLLGLRTRPVDGQPEMIRIVPEDRLKPGVYVLESKHTIMIEFEKFTRSVIAAGETAEREKRWDDVITSYLQMIMLPDVFGGETGGRGEMVRQTCRQLIAAARSALNQEQWDDALGRARGVSVVVAVVPELANQPARASALLEEVAEIILRATFDDRGDGTIADRAAGLMWTKDASREGTWADVRLYCDELEVGGHNDWRMPTLEELQRLYETLGVLTDGGRGRKVRPFIWGTLDRIWCRSPEDGGPQRISFDTGAQTMGAPTRQEANTLAVRSVE